MWLSSAIRPPARPSASPYPSGAHCGLAAPPSSLDGGTAEEVERLAHVATGMALEVNGGVRVLDAPEWTERRQALRRIDSRPPGIADTYR